MIFAMPCLSHKNCLTFDVLPRTPACRPPKCQKFTNSHSSIFKIRRVLDFRHLAVCATMKAFGCFLTTKTLSPAARTGTSSSRRAARSRQHQSLENICRCPPPASNSSLHLHADAIEERSGANGTDVFIAGCVCLSQNVTVNR